MLCWSNANVPPMLNTASDGIDGNPASCSSELVDEALMLLNPPKQPIDKKDFFEASSCAKRWSERNSKGVIINFFMCNVLKALAIVGAQK